MHKSITVPDIDEDDGPSPAEILDGLKNPPCGTEALRSLIFAAEDTWFAPEQNREVAALLRAIIADWKEPGEWPRLVAVASAVRKFVAIQPPDELESVEFIFDLGSLVLELEVAKMLHRKQSANPTSRPNALPRVADRLIGLVRAYLNPEMFQQRFYGAAALNCLLALVLLRSEHVPEALECVRQLQVPWFKESVTRRAAELQREMAAYPKERVRELAPLLSGLVDAAQNESH